MNNKTAKLIRKFAKATGQNHRRTKKSWLNTPKPDRRGLRTFMQGEVTEIE